LKFLRRIADRHKPDALVAVARFRERAHQVAGDVETVWSDALVSSQGKAIASQHASR